MSIHVTLDGTFSQISAQHTKPKGPEVAALGLLPSNSLEASHHWMLLQAQQTSLKQSRVFLQVLPNRYLVQLHDLVNLLSRILEDLEALLPQLNLHSPVQFLILHPRAVHACTHHWSPSIGFTFL